MFSDNEDNPTYKRNFINYLRALNPIFPRLLDGPPPPDAAKNVQYHMFEDCLSGVSGMVMGEHSAASLHIADFEEYPVFCTSISKGYSYAWRARHAKLDHREISRTVRLLHKLMKP
jgi:hypothetical protein